MTVFQARLGGGREERSVWDSWGSSDIEVNALIRNKAYVYVVGLPLYHQLQNSEKACLSLGLFPTTSYNLTWLY